MLALKAWWPRAAQTKQPFIWQGYAGTGKTTSIREALNRLQIPIERVALVTPTNRAAKIAQERSGLKAHTLHSLMFRTSGEEIDTYLEMLHGWEEAKSFIQVPGAKIMGRNSTADPSEYRYTCEVVVGGDVWFYDGNELPSEPTERIEIFQKVQEKKVLYLKNKLRQLQGEDLRVMPRDPEEIISAYDIIVVDEASMVNEEIGRHLNRIGLPIVYTGDPFQLPPVNAKCFWEGKEPDAMLTKIERQRGEGAGIPICGQEIRCGRRPIEGDGMFIHPRNQDVSFYDKADIILAGTHRTRRRINNEVRKHRGYKDVYPQPGEKVVSFSNFRKLGITNGEVYTVERVRAIQGRRLSLDVIDPFGKLIEDVPTWERVWRDESDMDFTDRTMVQMTFGYCITVHKGQGSEWNHVILCDDWSKSSAVYSRWLYTGITRASERCDLVR